MINWYEKAHENFTILVFNRKYGGECKTEGLALSDRIISYDVLLVLVPKSLNARSQGILAFRRTMTDSLGGT